MVCIDLDEKLVGNVKKNQKEQIFYNTIQLRREMNFSFKIVEKKIVDRKISTYLV